ncbi:MAG: outer membrane beta-barrel protein, partial [Nitrospiraceae bacterium]
MRPQMWRMRLLKRIGLVITIGGILTGVLVPVSFGAEPPVTPPPAGNSSVLERLDTLEKKMDAPSLWKTLGFKVSGFVDAAYTQNFNNPASDLNQLHIFDTNANAFMPHLAQIMLERPADAGGSLLDRAGFRARLNFGLDSRVTRARTNYQTGTSN